MQKFIIFLVSVISVLLIVNMIQHAASETVMKYFPIDETTDFEEANTNIKKGANQDTVEWSLYSKSEQPVYLRQDIGLLFQNGAFKGVQSKWKENTAELMMKQAIKPQKSAYLESISMHHGEVHQTSDAITSIQYMTTDHQYIRVHDQNWSFITHSDHEEDKNLQKKLKQETTTALHESWNSLFTYFQLDPEDYHAIPLVDLEKYHHENLPERTDEETKQIIGQLWEGLYKNYILELKNRQGQQINHFMPLILVAKDQTELFVMYELNGEKQLLKQRLP